MGIRLNIN